MFYDECQTCDGSGRTEVGPDEDGRSHRIICTYCDGTGREMPRDNINVDGIIFNYSSTFGDECYYADFGEHQIQISTRDKGIHWNAKFVFGTELEAHSPTDVARIALQCIKDIHKAI